MNEATSTAAGTTPARYPELDFIKGLAMLGVLLIHAKPIAGSVVDTYLVNRAVPILLVLFGAASELWSAARPLHGARFSAASFWLDRYPRLFPSLWLALSVWWAVRLVLSTQPPRLHWLLPHALAYIPQIGTGWFVTLIVQLVLLFPGLRWLVKRLGHVRALIASGILTVSCHLLTFDIVDWVRALLNDSAHVSGFFSLYYMWIFAPTYTLQVVAGIVIARHKLTWPARWGLISGLAWLAVCFVHASRWLPSLPQNALLAVSDCALAVALITACKHVATLRLAGPLRWIGRASWGMYLGQLVVHTSAPVFGFRIPGITTTQRFGYFFVLLVGAIVWVLLERLALQRLREQLAVRLSLDGLVSRQRRAE